MKIKNASPGLDMKHKQQQKKLFVKTPAVACFYNQGPFPTFSQPANQL
jgi:hypothetical protein